MKSSTYSVWCRTREPQAQSHRDTVALDEILMDRKVKQRTTEVLETEVSHILDHFWSTYRIDF